MSMPWFGRMCLLHDNIMLTVVVGQVYRYYNHSFRMEKYYNW